MRPYEDYYVLQYILNMKQTKNIRHRIAAVLAALVTTAAAEAQNQDKIPATVQLRTNTVYDLALCPNIGIEIQMNNGFAWQVDYVGAWWNNDTRHKYYSNYGLQAEMRYYIGSIKTCHPYSGHHIGIYGQTVTYDFEFGGTGWQSPHFNDSYGAGVSYGFTLPVSKKFFFDFTAGIGFFKSKYAVYEPKRTGGYLKTDYRRLNYFGPTKIEATIVWNITDNNK